MSRAVQTVFLIDIASLHSYDDNLITLDFEKSVSTIRYSCLKFLTYFGTRKTRWGCKFYCSNGLARQRMEKRPFSEHNLENFEDFEDQILRRFERYKAVCEAVGRMSGITPARKDPPCSIIKTALTQVASEFQWDAPDIASPVKPAKRRRLGTPDDKDEVMNCVFSISRSPVSYEDLDTFLGRPHEGVDIAGELMPPELQRIFVGHLNAKLIWLDTGSLASSSAQLSEFTSAMKRINGTIMPIRLAARVSGEFEGGTFGKESSDSRPFSSVAEFYIGSSTPRALPSTTAVIQGDERICHVAQCFDSVFDASPSDYLPAAGTLQKPVCWKEIHIMYRAAVPFETCALNSERLLGFRAEADTLKESLSHLRSILVDLACCREAAIVSLKSESPSPCHGILFPINDTAFCVHIVSAPTCLLPGCSTEPTVKPGLKVPTGDGLKPIPDWKERKSETIAKSFDATVLEKWYLPTPTTSPFLSSFCQQEPLSQKREYFLGKLQKQLHPKYASSNSKIKRDRRPKSDQVGRQPCAPRTLRKTLSLNISSRSAGMVAHCYVNQKLTAETTTRAVTPPSTEPGGKEVQPPRISETKIHDNEAQVVEQLKSLLEVAISSELPSSLVSCAQNIVSVVKHHVDSQQNAAKNALSAQELLEKHFVTSCAEITRRYPDLKDAFSRQRRLREYQFQVVLLLERELQFKVSASACVETVLSLLRTVSFIYGPSVANQFLVGPIKDGYLVSLHEVLLEICEELDVPLICGDPSSVLPDGIFSDLDSLPSTSSMLSQDSYFSGVPSSCSQRMADENRSRVHVALSQPSVLEKRQIVVPRAAKKRRDEPLKPMKESPRAAAKQVEEETANNVRRGLFVSPTKKADQPPDVITHQKRRILKTTFVPETPTHKQGKHVVLRRQERLRKRSGVQVMVSIVEETPQKLLFATGDKSTTPQKPLDGVSDGLDELSGNTVVETSQKPTQATVNCAGHSRELRRRARNVGKSLLLSSASTTKPAETPPRSKCPAEGTPSKAVSTGIDMPWLSPNLLLVPNAVGLMGTPSKSPRKVVNSLRTPTRPISKPGSTFSPGNQQLSVSPCNVENFGGAAPSEGVCATPQRQHLHEAFSVGETPPNWCGSEALFLSPETVFCGDDFERTPQKHVEFADATVSERGYSTTPRRRVSKRLLSSPATPKAKRATDVTPSKSPSRTFLSRNTNSPRRGASQLSFRVPSPEAGTTVPRTPERGSKKLCSRTKSPMLEAKSLGQQQCTVESANGNALCFRKRPNLRTMERAQPSENLRENAMQNDAVRNISVRTHQCMTSSTLRHEVEPVVRITRSKARETGLTPYEIFLLSQASPVKGSSGTSGALGEDRRNTCRKLLQSPRHTRPRKKMFTPPSALSVLHLTTSPMFLED